MPEGSIYYYHHTRHAKTRSDYKSTMNVYRPKEPDKAPQKAIYYNSYYESLKQNERAKLLSDEGKALYSQRKIDVESVFGQVKANLSFTRLHLLGKDKLKTGVELLFMANNLGSL
ncbi:transposase [Facklamia sp. P12934]|uniref:transposase n=1 Tax=Facklamia sp. P12934 TaxID=3421948 RepID=UPI003D1819AE